MKKLIYIAGVCALVAVQTSCRPQFEDLFEQSATERVQASIDQAKAVLTAADKGWSMGYFPTTDTRGCMLYAKFMQDGSVRLLDYNNGGKSDVTSYSMNASQGPVLNFDTYSDVLGHYTDPGTWQGGSTGNSGDFEFVVFHVTENQVTLKGKKNGAKIEMHRITGDADEETLWRQHYDACNRNFADLFSDAVNPLLKVGEKYYYTLTTPTSGVFTAYPYGSTNPEEATQLAFIATKDGIDLSKDLEVDGRVFRSFVHDPARAALVSREHDDVQIVGPDVYDYFAGIAQNHVATQDKLSGSFAAIFPKVADEFARGYEGRQVLEGFGFSRMRDGRLAFLLKTGRAVAMYAVPLKVENGTLTIGAFDAQNMSTNDMDQNGRVFNAKVPAVKELLALLPGTYTLKNIGGFGLSPIEMTSTTDANNKMTLSRN